MMHIRLSAVRYFSVRVTAVALALLSFSATADDGAFDIVFYLNTNSHPVTRLDRLSDMTDPLRAVLAMYAFQAGAGCNADKGPGFDCILTQALHLGPQCSPRHTAMVAAWFAGQLPDVGWPNGATSCYRSSVDTGLERTWERIRVQTKESQIIIDATGVSRQLPDGEPTRLRRFVTYQADHGQIKAISSVPYEYMLQTPGQIEGAQNDQGAQASPKRASEPLPTYEETTQDTMVIKTSFVSDLLPLRDGQLAFTSYAEDGNHRALRIIDGLHVRKSLLLPIGSNPFALNLLTLNEAFVVVADGCAFEVLDAQTGALLRRKQFSLFCPAGPRNAWLDGNMLTLISNSPTDSTLRRIRLPDLEVTESFQAPVLGAFVPWEDRFVAIGYWHAKNPYPMHSSIVILDREFRILTRSEIEPNQPRDHQICSTELFANPILRDDLLIYASDCGAIRLHDLKEMRQIAARAPTDSSRFPSFEIWNGKLLAFGPDDDRSGLIVEQVAIPTLQLTRTVRLPGKRVAASGPNFYFFEESNLSVPSHAKTVRITLRTIERDIDNAHSPSQSIH